MNVQHFNATDQSYRTRVVLCSYVVRYMILFSKSNNALQPELVFFSITIGQLKPGIDIKYHKLDQWCVKEPRRYFEVFNKVDSMS